MTDPVWDQNDPTFPWYYDWEELQVPLAAQRAWREAAGYYISEHALIFWEDPEYDWRHRLADRHQAMGTLFNCGVHSPIEEILGPWLLWVDADFLGMVEACREPWFDEGYKFGSDEHGFSVLPQVDVAGYRVDFMFVISHKNGVRRLAIECDGHDWHEKTKEQAARDKKRDRDLVLAGVQVMRFTGSEIWRDPSACFVQVQDMVRKLVNEVFWP